MMLKNHRREIQQLCLDRQLISKLLHHSCPGESEAVVVLVSAILGILFWVGICSWLGIIRPWSPAKQLVFAGKVVNSRTNEWPNNRLVLLFLKNKEIARTITNVGDFPQSNQGTHDGLFVIKVDNIYGLSESDISGFARPRKWFLFHEDFIYQYLPTVEEDSLVSIPVPSKNIQYVLKVLPGDASTLPPQIQVADSTELKDNNQVVLSSTTPNAQQPASENTNVTIQGVKYNVKTDTVETYKNTLPMNNCGGSTELTIDKTFSQTFLHQYQAEANANANADIPLPIGWPKLMIELQAKYGFEQNQVDARTEAYHFAAKPGTNQVYTIMWKEVWESGLAEVVSGTNTITVPFRVKTNLITSIDSSDVGCNG